VGISENVGNFITFKILTDDTHKVIYHSNLCSARDPTAQNLLIDLLNTGPPRSSTPYERLLLHWIMGRNYCLSLLTTVDTTNKTIWLLLIHTSSWDIAS
jgi:hypothetical protein